jgi:hypothetical protein
MKLRLVIIPALMATALFAQGPGGFGGRRASGNATNTPRTPPTPAQLAGRELNMIAAALHLTAAQTSTLTTNATLVADLTAEQTALQGNAAALKTAWTTADTTIAGGGTPDLTSINSLTAANLAARVTAAGQVLSILPGLGITLTPAQQTNLNNMLVRGGGPGGFPGRHF